MTSESGLDRSLACGLFFVSFAVYLAAAYPAFAPRDSADLALAALKLSVAHPPGYPLYALLGRLWLWLLPLGNPVCRLNLLSASAGAACAAAAFLVARRFAGRTAAAAAALALAFSAPVWKFCLLSEMYSLHLLFFLALLGLSAGGADSIRRRARACGLLLGLGLVNHQSLVLAAPALVWIWRGELRRHAADWRVPAASALAWGLLGLSVYAFVWLRLGSLSLAWAVVTRAEYGALTLAPGLSRGLTPRAALALLTHWAAGTALGAGALAVALAVWGAPALARKDRALAQGLGLAALLSGPVYFLLTRLDLSEWVAATVLESSFCVGAAAVCLFAAAGLDRFADSPRKMLSAPLALALALGPLWFNWAELDHRGDFSAYDYIRDLRRELPPGSAVLAGGDTAIFGLRLVETLRPRTEDLRLTTLREAPDKGWTAREAENGRVFALGLPLDTVRLWSRDLPRPQGLVQELASRGGPEDERAAWEVSVLRWNPALEGGESYAHDIRLAYAFAHHLSARLEEKSDPAAASRHDLFSAMLDPEDYHLELVPAPASGPMAP